MNKVSSLLAATVCCGLTLCATGQGKEKLPKPDQRHLIKGNLLLLGLKNFQGTYEYALHQKHTVGAHLNYMLHWKYPRRPFEYENITVSNGEFWAKGITIAYKYYPFGGRKSAYQGFHAGVQLRYQKLLYNLDVQVSSPDLSANLEVKNVLNSYSAGIEIGYQLHFTNNWLLDFTLLAPRYAHNVYNARLGKELTGELYEELSEGMAELMGYDALGLLIAIDNPVATGRFNFIGLRLGISLGYTF